MLFTLWLACQPKIAVTEPVQPPGAVLAPKPTDPVGLDDRMMTHFQYATAAQQAVVAGDLDGARVAAAKLGTLTPLEGASADWNANLIWIQQRSLEIAAAKSLGEASTGVAALGQGCGGCHAREHRGPLAPASADTSQAAAAEQPMTRHARATTLMWFGVIGADAGAFDAGLALLAEPPTWDPRSDKPRYGDLQGRLHDLAATPAVHRTARDRSVLYGEVLATCAACHDRYRK